MYAEKTEKTASQKDKTGIPRRIKAEFEQSSGFSFDDVRVHYNSEKPAQLHAHAYTQGNNVYVAPGQEMHLPHELGHVVQQKSDMVKPTSEINGLPLNDDEAMENGADKIAENADNASDFGEIPVQAKFKDDGVVQRAERSQENYNYYAGEMSGISSVLSTTLGIVGGIGTLGSFLYSKNTTRKHRYIEDVEKYADAACEAQEEQVELAEPYKANISRAPAKIQGKMRKLAQKIKRNYEAALSKAHAMGEFESEDKRRGKFTGLFLSTEPTGEPPKIGNEANSLDNIQDKNVKAALLRAKNAYEKCWIETNDGGLQLLSRQQSQ